MALTLLSLELEEELCLKHVMEVRPSLPNVSVDL